MTGRRFRTVSQNRDYGYFGAFPHICIGGQMLLQLLRAPGYAAIPGAGAGHRGMELHFATGGNLLELRRLCPQSALLLRTALNAGHISC